MGSWWSNQKRAKNIEGIIMPSDLSGTESYSFWDKWNLLKNRIAEIMRLKSRFYSMRRDYEGLRSRAIKVGNPELIKQVEDNYQKVTKMHEESVSVVAQLNKWLPSFLRAEKEYQGEEHPISSEYGAEYAQYGLGGMDGLGVAPIVILGAAGMAVLGYVTVKGLGLIKDYKVQYQILNDVRMGVIKAEQAAGMLWPGGGSAIGKIALYGGLIFGTIYAAPMILGRLSR